MIMNFLIFNNGFLIVVKEKRYLVKITLVFLDFPRLTLTYLFPMFSILSTKNARKLRFSNFSKKYRKRIKKKIELKTSFTLTFRKFNTLGVLAHTFGKNVKNVIKKSKKKAPKTQKKGANDVDLDE